MSDHDSFEERLQEIAEQISRSVQRLSDVDLEELADRYGIDADHARAVAGAAGQWLNERLAGNEPLFGQSRPRGHDRTAPESGADSEPPPARRATPGAKPGPHPLDFPTGRQGLVLSALDSGRWTVRSGSNQLADTGIGPPPTDALAAPDVVSDLRARDWITADGALTLVGRHALARWCRTATEPPSPGLEPDDLPG